MAPRTVLSQNIHRAQEAASKPTIGELQVSYGKVYEVHADGDQVRPLLFDGEWSTTPYEFFLPLITPLSEVHLKWGSLRKGLTIRIWHHGPLSKVNGLVEIIGEEGDWDFLTKEKKANILNTGPYKLITGGLLSI